MENNTQKKASEYTPGVYQGSPEALIHPIGSSVLRTMKNDIADAIKSQKETVVSMALSEERKKATQRADALAIEKSATEEAGVPVVSPAPHPVGRVIVVVIFILVLVVIFFMYRFLTPKISMLNAPKIPHPGFGTPSSKESDIGTHGGVRVLSLIPAQKEQRFSMTKDSTLVIFTTIAGEITKKGNLGVVENFYITEDILTPEGVLKTEPITGSRFLSVAGVSVPDILRRSVEDAYMSGSLGEINGETPTPFVILKVSDHNSSVAGMLEWEQELPNFFDAVFGTTMSKDVTNRTKTRDSVVLGRDARVINIAPGVSISYTFANPATIIIAGSKTALEKLISLLSSR